MHFPGWYSRPEIPYGEEVKLPDPYDRPPGYRFYWHFIGHITVASKEAARLFAITRVGGFKRVTLWKVSKRIHQAFAIQDTRCLFKGSDLADIIAIEYLDLEGKKLALKDVAWVDSKPGRLTRAPRSGLRRLTAEI